MGRDLTSQAHLSTTAMSDKIKSKLRPSKTQSEAPIESPLLTPPKYVDDNPMFPAKPSKHKSDERIGFVLGTEYP